MRFKKSFLATIDRLLSALNALITAIPATTLLMFFILAFSTRISLGRWPVVYRDDFPNGAINTFILFALLHSLSFVYSIQLDSLSGTWINSIESANSVINEWSKS